VLWGVNGALARSLFQRQIDPAHLVQVRMILGGLALLPLALLRRERLARRGLGALVLYAGFMAVAQLTYFKAIQLAGVAVALFLQYTSPLMVAAWEGIRARQAPSRALALALAVAATGSALLVLPGGGLRVTAAGVAWGIGSAISISATTVLAGALRRRGTGSASLVAGGLLLGSLAFLPLRSPWSALTAIAAPDWPYFLYVALLATAAPFALFASALSRLRGTTATLVAMIEPVLGSALAWIFLSEPLSAIQLAGGACIVAAVALVATASRN
jgi:drug/metabolite transporter (DMT)-like permease